jgi:hypothetical protein
MTFFLIVMCVGLVGLVAMALPGLFHHGLTGHGHATTHLHGAGPHVAHHGHAAPPPSHAGTHAGHAGGHAAHGGHAVHAGKSLAHLIPEPRLIFSFLALYGAFGNALVGLSLAPVWLAVLVALLPALLVERYLLQPLWSLAFRFQGQPSSPFPALLLEEAHAVTPFRNGKGLVRVVRDGRSVQLSARLVEAQSALPVRVGDRLRIEEVDPEKERVTVSLF